MDQPSCIGIGKLLGHTYVAHYDVAKGSPQFNQNVTEISGTADAVERFRPVTKTYICSVCTRCGHVLKREDIPE